jgi:hypothetical protein
MPERCQATTRSGKRCGATVVAEGMCAWHAPSWDAKRRAWSAEGGRKRSNAARARKELPAEPLTTAELHSWLGVAFKSVLAGKMEPGVGTAAASIARTMAELAKIANFEDELAAMRREIAELAETRAG